MSVKNGMKSSIQSRDVHLEDLIELREAQELHKVNMEGVGVADQTAITSSSRN